MKIFINALLRLSFATALAAVSVFAFAGERVQFLRWSVFDKTDEISGEVSAFATSDSVAPTRQLGFPYSDVKAWLGVGCDTNGRQWAYVGFTAINSRDESLRVRWDDEQTTHKISVSDNDFAGFSHDARVISRMQSSTEVVIGIDWFQEGEVFFKWGLYGSSDAIKEARRRCGF